MIAWPTPPAELRRAVAMLAGFHDLQSFEAFCGRGPSPVGPFDRELGIAVLLAEPKHAAVLVDMRARVHQGPALDTPTGDPQWAAWSMGWWNYRHCVSLLDDVAVSRHAELDDWQRAGWWERAS